MTPCDHEHVKQESVADTVSDMKLDPGGPADGPSSNGGSAEDDPVNSAPGSPGQAQVTAQNSSDRASSSAVKSGSQTRSPVKAEPASDDMEQKVGGDITVKLEPGKPPKLSRSSSQKVVARPPQLFNHLPDSLEEACSTFELIDECIYANKYMGYTEHAMECDCSEEWDPVAGKNHACGEDSDCINRATRIECLGDCGCGPDCQNQRFQRKEFAKVTVIKTEKKGFGLRAETDLRPHQFIYEYVGEVINEAQFRRRMRQYDEEGIKHFYFMSLNKGEFVDATKKGNLARFCNHSCNPNCYVDKWVVGEKLRMGIFAERHIKAGEELVFNYNVDRYGADPQPCYCGEPNCTGFIGGKTQTERATKLSNATIEALGIEDADDWDLAVAKRPRKKKTEEADEEYVDSVQPKSLDENGVTKVMAALMQCNEKWIAVKLLGRIQRCEDERVRNRVVKMHGYRILNSQLSTWKDDVNVVLQILDILDKLPRLTRNKIIDSKIESTVQPLTTYGDERVETKAKALMEVWSTLEVGYRIPRMKRDPTATTTPQVVSQFERREAPREERKRSRSRSRSRSPSIEAPRGPAAQTRGGYGHRSHYHRGPRPPRQPLPPGWFEHQDKGRTYYYTERGDVTWVRPTLPAPDLPPSNAKMRSMVQNIIDEIMASSKTQTPRDKTTTPSTPAKEDSEKENGREKWRSYPEEKQKRIYENTLFPHVKYVMDKFRQKLPREDLKRYAKEVAKKLVNSDFKNNRVEDPTKISEKQQKKVKKFCKEYFDKAVAKHRAYEQKKAEKVAQAAKAKKEDGKEDDSKLGSKSPPLRGESADLAETQDDAKDDEIDNDGDANISDDEVDSKKLSPIDPEEDGDRAKRKRDTTNDTDVENDDASPVKRRKSSTPPSEQHPSVGLDDDLSHSGISTSHEGIGVVR